jgi:hypothetical protein
MTTIYEPLYAEGQSLSEARFTPLRLPSNVHSAWREVRILVDFYRRGDHRCAGKTGIFSPKFGLKTKVSADEFLRFVDESGESDVCIINPFPTIPYYSFNVWMQGEVNHPGLLAAAKKILDASDILWDLSAVPRHNQANLCYSNFWVGTEKFWDGYVGGILDPIATYIESNPDSPAARAVMIDTWHTDSAPFLPFIVERLFSTYLSLTPGVKIAAFPIADPLDYCLTDYEREMVARIQPIVDAADRAKSFSHELISIQETLCRLYVRYAKEHFASNAHPHSGKKVQSS